MLDTWNVYQVLVSSGQATNVSTYLLDRNKMVSIIGVMDRWYTTRGRGSTISLHNLQCDAIRHTCVIFNMILFTILRYHLGCVLNLLRSPHKILILTFRWKHITVYLLRRRFEFRMVDSKSTVITTSLSEMSAHCVQILSLILSIMLYK